MSAKLAGKRKRGSSAANAIVIYDPKAGSSSKRRRREFVPGRDRVGGYYGRYANGGELKFHDVDLVDAVVAAGFNVTETINIIAQGVTESTRVGRKCTIKSINWHWRVNLPAADAVAVPRPLIPSGSSSTRTSSAMGLLLLTLTCLSQTIGSRSVTWPTVGGSSFSTITLSP